MKSVTFVALIALLAGCSDRATVPGVDSIGTDDKLILGGGGSRSVTYRVIVIDECEYIFGTDNGPYNGGYFLAHKGDCKSRLHQPPAVSP